MHKPIALIFLLSLWLPTIQVAPATPITLAVLELEAKGVAQNEAAVLTDKLRTVLISSESFRVIDREKMDDILTEQRIPSRLRVMPIRTGTR